MHTCEGRPWSGLAAHDAVRRVANWSQAVGARAYDNAFASRATFAWYVRRRGNGTSRGRSCPTSATGRVLDTVRGRKRDAEAERAASRSRARSCRETPLLEE